MPVPAARVLGEELRGLDDLLLEVLALLPQLDQLEGADESARDPDDEPSGAEPERDVVEEGRDDGQCYEAQADGEHLTLLADVVTDLRELVVE